MRVWELEDSKAMPSDLVLEQDFILRVRRMQRHAAPCLVINFVINAVEQLAKSHSALEAVQVKLRDFAKITSGAYFEMSNGDVFIVWENAGDAQGLAQSIVTAILPEQSGDATRFFLTYHMPKDYTALRERSNHYVEVVRAAVTMGHGAGSDVTTAHGPLTAKSLDKISDLLGEIDLRQYSRTQNIYRRRPEGWQAVAQEYFIGFEDLRRERFPKLEIVSTEHFFMALCGMVDQRLLSLLINSYELISGRYINLNLSIETIVSPVFAKFVHHVPRDQRNLIGFEIHRGDLLQDFTLTLSVIQTLRHEGFRIALDSVTPDMVNYIDLASFDVDRIKVNVSKDRAAQLDDPLIRAGFKKLPADKLIFFRCDNERALAAGIELGVSVFQGWLIDDLVAGKKS
jgi:EAL domain-containing protein (putative c-di-GMP-specific phosphodiesterase class I)